MKKNLFKHLLVLSSIFIVGCNNQTTSNNSTSNQDTSSSSKLHQIKTHLQVKKNITGTMMKH